MPTKTSSSEPQAGTIKSNLRRSPDDYDVDLPTPVITNPLPYTDSSSSELMDAEALEFARAYAAARPQRWEGQERWMGKDNEEMRLVNVLHPHAVIRKLQDAGIAASLEPAVAEDWQPDPKTGILIRVERNRSNARLWLHDVVIRDMVGISAWVNGKAQYITWLQYPLGPEWSLMYFDQYDVPIRERYRGWRTAMLRLIEEEVLTEEEVDRAFGPVVMNEASSFYREQLAALRNRRNL